MIEGLISFFNTIITNEVKKQIIPLTQWCLLNSLLNNKQLIIKTFNMSSICSQNEIIVYSLYNHNSFVGYLLVCLY